MLVMKLRSPINFAKKRLESVIKFVPSGVQFRE